VYPIFPFLPETHDVLLKLRRWADRVQAGGASAVC
jgi:hypothetical protein